MQLHYIHLPSGSSLPEISHRPFRAVVVVDEKVTEEWRGLVSAWLVASGCLYMMAWGDDCSRWDDSVDYANLEEFNYGVIPEERFVYTTWHENQALAEAFWFSEHCATHPVVEFEATIILDITATSRAVEMLSSYERATADSET